MYRGLWRKGWVSGAFQNTGRKFMISQKIANSVKNAVSTVVLLMGAFFVCSTVLSMRAVLADPIAPVNTVVQTAQSPRNSGTVNRAPGRANPRGVANRATVARTTSNVAPARVNAQARPTTSARSVANRTVAGRAGNIASPRMVTTVQSPRTNAVSTRANTANARSVVSRSATTRAGVTEQRAVRARNSANVVNASDAARISLQGSAIRGSKGSVSGTTLQYLSGKLYTGNYSNIIDSTTGLISADAFNNCMESYYTCMDEICTARNQAQRRCACAGRVKTFADIERSLEAANEDLIKVSGELALLVSSKGKDISSAFQLTDAEKVMNCVSWKEMSDKFKSGDDEDGDSVTDDVEWCQAHGFYNSEDCGAKLKPKYCESDGNNFGFDVNNIGSTGSDILATLQAWANLKDQTITVIANNNDSLLSAFQGVSSVVNGLVGIDGALTSSEPVKDSLAETWGYELFQYAHNNVCARVLDSCFNGIYEACGTPPEGVNCTNGKTSCPYNYNSRIDINNTGEYDLKFVTGKPGQISASCDFGYGSSNGSAVDPYSSLRGPVAEARRSIMQKYALDANADCDLYGEQLRATAQNINYQKVAAQQALQQKRLEFATENEEEVLTAAVDAGTNFNQCISELWECYTETAESESAWSSSRIKTYCAQIANVPSCYEEMICNPSRAQFKAVIDKPDSTACVNSQDYKENTCRNIVTLNEILNGASELKEYIDSEGTGDSAAMREACMLDAGVGSLRSWTKRDNGAEKEDCTSVELAKLNASAGDYDETDKKCVPKECVTGFRLGADTNGNISCIKLESVDCSDEIEHALSAVRKLNADNKLGTCELNSCETHYVKSDNKCLPETTKCNAQTLTFLNATDGIMTWDGNPNWGNCVATQCILPNTKPNNGVCPSERDCTAEAKDAKKAVQVVENGKPGECVTKQCNDGFSMPTGVCLRNSISCAAENATVAEQKLQSDGKYGDCIPTECKEGYKLSDNKCVKSE